MHRLLHCDGLFQCIVHVLQTAQDIKASQKIVWALFLVPAKWLSDTTGFD
jgi:hypothetical protein